MRVTTETHQMITTFRNKLYANDKKCSQQSVEKYAGKTVPLPGTYKTTRNFFFLCDIITKVSSQKQTLCLEEIENKIKYKFK